MIPRAGPIRSRCSISFNYADRSIWWSGIALACCVWWTIRPAARRLPIPQCVGKGEVLQPLLYALAAEQALEENVVTGRLHYATLRSNYREIDITLNEFTRGMAGKALGIIDESLRQGFLPAAPREKACERCDYRVVCGPYEEERSGRKSKPELKSLRELRSMK